MWSKVVICLNWIGVFASGFVLCTSAYSQITPDKSGTKPTVLSIPSGPGSIEGLGKSFQPQLNTGAASYEISLTLPAGPGGFAPGLALKYNTGFGNGPLGRGWRLVGPLAIERQTDKGFPHYRDRDREGAAPDVFVFEGEELVPLSDGTYRLENDESFRRFSPKESQPGGAIDSWLIEDRDGTRRWLGRHGRGADATVSRIEHPLLVDRSPFAQTFRWLEDAAEDVNGNRIDYHYRAHRDSPGTLYLAGLTYRAVGTTDAFHVVELRTETRPDRLSDYRSGFERRWSRRYREISVGSYFDDERHPVRAYKLSYDPNDRALALEMADARSIGLGISALHAVMPFGADRSWGGTGEPGTPLPPTRFSYALPTLTQFSTALKARVAGLNFRLRRHEPDPLVAGPVIGQLLQETSSGLWNTNFDTPLHDPRVQFADVDGDGLVDILDTRVDWKKRTYTVARNLGGGRFQASRPVKNPAGLHLGQNTKTNQTFLSDTDGDGVIDLVQITGESAQRRTLICKNLARERLAGGAMHENLGFSGAAEDFVIARSTPNEVDTTDPAVRQIDLNFDKISDVLVWSEGGLTGYFATSEGRWQVRAAAPGDGTIEPSVLSSRYRFSIDLSDGRRIKNPLVQLADMNGDRLLDLVRILVRKPGEAEVRYRPMTGSMTWGDEVAFHFALSDGSPSSEGAILSLPGINSDRRDRNNRWDAIRIVDANGDGLSDILFVESGGVVRLYFNAHGSALSGPYKVPGVPGYQPNDPGNPTLLRTADINGNGSVDLVFYHRRGDPEKQGIRYLEFIGGQKAGLLQVTDNGIGLRTYIRYKPAVVDQLAAERVGKPWTNVSPVPMWVVSGIVDDIGLDLNRDGESDRYATTFRYRDPYYDGFEKQFRGFRFVQQIEWGDDIDPKTGLPSWQAPVAGHRTTVTRFRFHTGAPDRVDNDDYIDGFDTETRAAFQVIDEKTTLGGREEEPLKGKLLLQESIHPLALLDPYADFDVCSHGLTAGLDASRANIGCTPDRYVFRRETHLWKVRRLYRPLGAVAPKGRLLKDEPNTIANRGMSVSFPYRAETRTTLPEANEILRESFNHPAAPVAAAKPVTLRVDFDYDNFGNVILERNWGVTNSLEPSDDDERIVRSTFALSLAPDGPWILNRIASRRVEDELGNFVSEVRSFYDGPPFVGLPLGQIGRRGLESRREARISDRSAVSPPLSWLPASADSPLPAPGDPRATTPEWIVQERAAYDEAGNKIVKADGLAQLVADGQPDPEEGHVLLTKFDSVFRTFPVEERLWVGSGKPDLVFRAAYVSPETEYSAAVHWGHGLMTRFWDANDHQSDYLYDQYGRLTSIRSPGDSDELPTFVYTYQPADPHRGLRYEYDRWGRLQPNGHAVPVANHLAANLVATDRRETAGAEGVFRRAAFSTGRGSEVLRLEEDSDGGYAVFYAARFGLRSEPVFEAKPYRQPTLDFQVPGFDVTGTDLSRDSVGRIIRRRLPPEADHPSSPRLETRVHYLPLSEWRFDEEDLASVEPSQDHRRTPLVLTSDGLQRLISTTEHVKISDTTSAWQTRYFYDLNDKLAGILDSQDNLRLMRHDGLGRRIALNDVNRGLLQVSFDAANNVIETLDAKDQKVTYRYDGINRMVSEDYHDAGQPFSSGREHDPSQPLSDHNRPDVVFTYDSPLGHIDLNDGNTVRPSDTRGFLTSISDLSGEEHISYDARGRVAWQVKRVAPAGATLDASDASYQTVMTYDSSDRLTDIDYPDGTHTSYDYDARSRTRKIESPQLGIIIADQTYTAAGLRAATMFGNGVLTSRTYDPRLRPSSIASLSQQEGSTLLDYRYRYDGASNVLLIEDRRPSDTRSQRYDNSQAFSYDDLFRLKEAAYKTGKLFFSYDQLGNMTERRFADSHGTPGDTAVAPGRIHHGGMAGSSGRIGRSASIPGPHAPSSDDTGRTYTYDANGNLSQLADMTLVWDFKDRLVAVDAPMFRAEYVYDYTGRRIIKRIMRGPSSQRSPPVETKYISKYFEVVAGTAHPYVFDGATRLAGAGREGDLLYYHHDLLASTDTLSDPHGASVQSTAFLPFGEPRTRYVSGRVVETGGPDYLFAQKEHDHETGLSYFEARYLNSILGRFVSVDPATIVLPAGALESPQLLNGYAFAANNPLRYTDSTGQWLESAWDVTSLGISISAARRDPSLLNLGSVAVDLIAVAAPVVPGGAGAILHGRSLVSGQSKMLPAPMKKLKYSKKVKIQMKNKRDLFHSFGEKIAELVHSHGKIVIDELRKHKTLRYVQRNMLGSMKTKSGKLTEGVFEIGEEITKWRRKITHRHFRKFEN